MSSALTPAVFSILLALYDRERHGYDIMRQVHEDSGGRIAMGPGTLYGSLDRMMDSGLVARSRSSPDSRRVYYRITAKGERALQTESERIARAARVASRRLRLTGV